MTRIIPAARKTTFILVAVMMGIALLVGVGGRNAITTSAQGSEPFCLSDELLSRSLQQNPALRKTLDEQEAAIRDYSKSHSNKPFQPQSSTSNFIVPVVVYIVHTGGSENITDQQVNSQIAALNTAFSSQGIQFCLATKEGSTSLAGPTPGIIRVNSPLTNHLMSNESSLKAVTPLLPGDRYLRIWVVKNINNGSGVVGYARFPGSVPLALEGIVMRHDVFGEAATCGVGCSNLLPNYDQGEILAHEIGHYLNLYHTFHGGCSGISANDCGTAGDRVCDTPQIAAPSSGCPLSNSVVSCNGTAALIDNHMDYTNDVCRAAFTPGQDTRMIATLNIVRQPLVSPANHVFTGVQCSGFLNASFAIDNPNACTNQAVTFDALDTSGATFAWDFGDGTTGNTDPATHTYTTAGTYTVTLTATSGSNSVSSTQQVFVTACALINSSQGNWFFGTFGELHFNTGVALPGNAALTNNTINVSEACIAQSDSSGNLLFYSDGRRLWNNLHALVNNGNFFGGGNDPTQALAVPDPADPNPANPSSFYLISMRGYSSGTQTNGNFSFTKVSASGSNVTFSAVNSAIAPPVGADNNIAEMVTTVPACGNNYWIIVHGSYQDTNPSLRHALFVYPLTGAGIGVPAIYPIAGPALFGQLKAAPDGTRIAYGTGDTRSAVGSNSGYAHVLDFDRNTGTVSNPRVINRYVYGVSFSPNSQLLYLTDSVIGPEKIFQYDLNAANLNASETLVAEVPAAYSALQLGPDNKIYAALHGYNHLAVINYPDQRNTGTDPNACGYSFNGPFLNIPSTATSVGSRFGLPNMIDARKASASSVPADFSYTISSCSTFNFSAPACAASYSWDFGDSTSTNQQNPTHVYQFDGTRYKTQVTLTLNGSTTVTREIEIGMSPFSATIFGPSQVCLASGSPPLQNYSANTQPGMTYNWTVTGGTIAGFNNNDNVDVVWSTLPGTVQLTATNQATGCQATKTLTVIENCDPNACVAAPEGLVNWWPFDETGGPTAQDVRGAVDNAGTHVNNPTPAPGIVNGALSFNGTNWVEVADDPELNFFGGCLVDVAEQTTIDLWLKTNIQPGTGPNSGLLTILDKRVTTGPKGYHLFLFNGRLGFQIDGTNYVAPATGPDYVDVADNQWHFVAVSLPTCRVVGGIFRGFLYVDGKPVLTLPNGGGFENTAKLYIGRRDPAFGANFFKGSLDELEIFKIALSDDELRALFEVRSRGKCLRQRCPEITINPATLINQNWGTNVPYPALNLIATGGSGPYTFTVTNGNLPPGMVVDADGTLHGTPVTPGTYAFAVTVEDATGCPGVQQYQIVIVNCPAITLNPAAGALAAAVVDTPYSQTFTATGGCASSFTFSVTNGALPPGLALSANGMLSGTPTHPGDSTFTVTATDSCGCSQSQTYTLTVVCPTLPPSAALRISEFRFNGPNGSTDEFFEIYNASSTDHEVGTTSLSNNGGYGLFASAGNGVTSNTVTLVCRIPNGTIIPARGYVLCTGGGYSLASLGAVGSSTGSSTTPTIDGAVATAAGNFPIINGTAANPGIYTSADVPNDAGLLLANVGEQTVGASPDSGTCTFGFGATGVLQRDFIVFDRVGFAPYGSGAPLQSCHLSNPAACGVSGNARPSLADNYCESTAAQCLRPVGDASTTNHGSLVFYGDSGQYSLLRRQTVLSVDGTVPQDTGNNADDFLMVSPLPGINIAFNITNFPTGFTDGLVSVLGAAGPQNNAAPPDLGELQLQSSLFDSTRSFGQLPNAERRYVIDTTTTTIENNPMGFLILRFGFRNTSTTTDINRLRFRVDNLSVPCGQASPPAGTGVVGSGNARNLSQTSPNCQGSDATTAVLKMLNWATELVSPENGPAEIVRGSVIEDTDGTKLAPNGGGVNNSLVRTGTTPGNMTGEFTTVVPAGSPGPRFFIGFRMGVVKGGRFRFLFQPEGSSN